jgi:hypothetical protein
MLRPGDDPKAPWTTELLDSSSSGFEHTAIITDLDGDGVEELYVANDKGSEINRFTWSGGIKEKRTIYTYPDGINGFTWNMMPFPVALAPEPGA